MNSVCYQNLMSRTGRPGETATLALAGVIAGVWQREVPRIGADSLARLFRRYFPGVKVESAIPCRYDALACHVFRVDEYDDLVELLLEHRSHADEDGEWLAHAIAAACMDDNHLWQDMGLPDRTALSSLLQEHFRALFDKNTANMKWKKFFYKQLCARAGINICKAPSCAICTDYKVCFEVCFVPEQ
jgi:nitrogen fixation protein NifQ